MLVRPFDNRTDEDLLAEAEIASFKSAYPGMTLPIGVDRARFERIKSGSCHAFTLTEEYPIGCIALSMTSFENIPIGYIENVYVKPEFRSSGGLDQLLDAAKIYFFGRGARVIRLNVTTHNQRAFSAYRKRGFAITTIEMELPISPYD